MKLFTQSFGGSFFKRYIFLLLMIFSTQIFSIEKNSTCLRSFDVKDKIIFKLPQSNLKAQLEQITGTSCQSLELARESLFLSNNLWAHIDNGFSFETEVLSLKKQLSLVRKSVKRDLIYRIASGVAIVSTVYCLTGEPIGCTASVVASVAAFTRMTDMEKLKQLNKEIATLEKKLSILQRRWDKNNQQIISSKNQLFNDMCWIVKNNCL